MTEPGRYRREVVAIRYTGDNFFPCIRVAGNADCSEHIMCRDTDCPRVWTKSGSPKTARPGQWLIPGPDGRTCEVLDDDEFRANYAPAPSETPR